LPIRFDCGAVVGSPLAVYQGPDGFVAPGELIVCTGTVD